MYPSPKYPNSHLKYFAETQFIGLYYDDITDEGAKYLSNVKHIFLFFVKGCVKFLRYFTKLESVHFYRSSVAPYSSFDLIGSEFISSLNTDSLINVILEKCDATDFVTEYLKRMNVRIDITK